MIETELKYWLTRAAHTKLLAALARYPQRTENFTNEYWDTPRASLRARKVGFRSRRTHGTGKTVWTLKAPPPPAARGETRAGLQRMQEWESPRAAPLRARAKAFLGPREKLSDLRALFSMEASRTSVRYGGEVWEVDTFTVGGRRYFELEVETKDPAATDRRARALFRRLKIKARASRKSKLARAWLAHEKRRV